MGLLALFLILFWVGIVARHLIYKGHNDREVNRRLREQAKHTPAPGQRLSPEQAEWFARQQLMEDAELDVEYAKTAAHLQRMARTGPGYAIAGNLIVGMAGYEMWRHHEDRRHDDQHGFDANPLPGGFSSSASGTWGPTGGFGTGIPVPDHYGRPADTYGPYAGGWATSDGGWQYDGAFDSRNQWGERR